jgi:hypothetical protein
MNITLIILASLAIFYDKDYIDDDENEPKNEDVDENKNENKDHDVGEPPIITE